MMAQDGTTTDDSTKKTPAAEATSTSSSTNVSNDILTLQSDVTLSLTTSALTIDGTIGGSRVSYTDEWLRPQ